MNIPFPKEEKLNFQVKTKRVVVLKMLTSYYSKMSKIYCLWIDSNTGFYHVNSIYKSRKFDPRNFKKIGKTNPIGGKL